MKEGKNMEENKGMAKVMSCKMKAIHKAAGSLLAFIMLFMMNGFYSQASTNIGENVGHWFLDQIFWVAIVAIVIVIAASAVKRNYVGVIITIIVGAVVLFLIKNPTVLQTFGEKLGNIFMNGGSGE